jgi:hypothetical protein
VPRPRKKLEVAGIGGLDGECGVSPAADDSRRDTDGRLGFRSQAHTEGKENEKKCSIHFASPFNVGQQASSERHAWAERNYSITANSSRKAGDMRRTKRLSSDMPSRFASSKLHLIAGHI